MKSLKLLFRYERFKNYLNCTILLFTIFFIVLIFGPVYISNNSNTLLDYRLLIWIALGCFAISLLLAGFSLFFPRKYKYLACVLTSIMLLCFINATIIPFQAPLLDGNVLTTMKDDIIPLLRNFGMFALLVIIVFVLWKNIKRISLPILLICFVFTIFTYYETYSQKVVLNEEGTFIKSTEETLHSAATFSSKKNIIVIGLDMLQGTAAEKAFLQNPDLLDDFDGFTLFTRSFSSFPFTNYAMPVINSGQEYSYTDTDDYLNNLLGSIHNSFMTDLQSDGVRIDSLGLDLYNIFPSVHELRSSKNTAVYGYSYAASVARLTGYWPFNPLAEENPFSEIDGGTMYTEKVNSIEFYQHLQKNFSVGDETPKLLYFWDYTPHTPIAFNRDGGVNAVGSYNDTVYNQEYYIEETTFVFSQLISLFETMKKNGVYDNSLIILVSDHGHFGGGENHLKDVEDFQYGYKANGNMRGAYMYNTILFVKPPNATGTALITHEASWNGDVRSIINYYNENFNNTPPANIVSDIRAQNPKIKIMFVPAGSNYDMYWTSSVHHPVEVSSLYEIPAAFTLKSGIEDE